MPMARSARIAAALWIAWAVVVFNVVLDQVIAVAGRRYIVEAIASAGAMGPYVRIDDWMRPAAVRGFWLAGASACGSRRARLNPPNRQVPWCAWSLIR